MKEILVDLFTGEEFLGEVEEWSFASDYTTDQWEFEIRNDFGIGVSDDDEYPLSTYYPINKAQEDIILNYYYLYHEKYHEKLATIEDYKAMEIPLFKELAAHNDTFSFNERYFDFYYFQQAVMNQAHITNRTSELIEPRNYFRVLGTISAQNYKMKLLKKNMSAGLKNQMSTLTMI